MMRVGNSEWGVVKCERRYALVGVSGVHTLGLFIRTRGDTRGDKAIPVGELHQRGSFVSTQSCFNSITQVMNE